MSSAARASAASVTLAWDPSPSEDVAGYTLLYGTSPGSYPKSIQAGMTTTLTISTLPDGTYYFVVQAYSLDGVKSPMSNQVVVTIGSTSPSLPPISGGCTTPDPFASMGGGTCYNGGWLPPGMTVPGTSPAPSTPPPSSITPPVLSVPPPSSGGCTTPNPFAAMGGGTCYNGGWLPPGMPVPGGGTTTPSTPPPPSVSVPPPSSSGCTTPDPFASMGGGTCYNGGWLPPGMPVPGGTTTPSTPAPPPSSTTPPPVSVPPSSSGCSTPNPFAAMGGGTCYNGGWLPPGMPVPGGATPTSSTTTAAAPAPQPPVPSGPTTCQTADPFGAMGGGSCYRGAWLPPGMELTVTGTLTVVSLEDELWVIEGHEGTMFTSPTALRLEMLVDGAVVTFRGITLPSAGAGASVVVVEIISIVKQS